MINVLMIDDEQVVLDVSKLFLERQGNISVDCVLSASGGIEKLQSGNYDAIICDYDMDEIDGISFLKAIRGIYPGIESPCPDIPFIIFTGKGDECIVIEALNCGADFYLQKGNDPRGQLLELAHKIEDVVSHRFHDEIMDTAFENTGTCMVILDENNSVIRMNRQMSDVLGVLGNDKYMKINFDSFVSKNDQKSVIEFLDSQRLCLEKNKTGRNQCRFNLCSLTGKTFCAIADAAYIPEKKIYVLSIRVE